MAINIYRPEYVKKLFNSMSGSYERMNYITSFGFSIRWRRQCLQHMEPSAAPVEIMDLLTGMGETWHAIKQKFPNGHISALDFSPDMLKKAARKNTRYFNNEITLWQQDLLQNGLPDNHFDLVVCAYGLKTFNRNQLEIVAKETARILKPGGRFAFVEVSRPEPKILQLFYRFYLAKVIPLLGRLFLGDPTAYRMLWKYTELFQNAQQAADLFRQAGLHPKPASYFYGCATGFSGSK